jgi:hypothetical protein
MHLLSLPQPWASLLARGAARFVVREDATAYRGTVAIHAADAIDDEAVERLQSDVEFAEHMTALGFTSAGDFDALPREAIVGVAVIADLWSLESLEEVATEDDAILLGDVTDTAMFWELAEPVELPPHAALASDFAPMAEALPESLVATVQDAAQQLGARFDDDGLVFWPVAPTASLAALIGDDAIGDREITGRVWSYVVEHDLQDPEDHAYVYLDDALRAALETDAEGMPTIEFTDCVVAQMRRLA